MMRPVVLVHGVFHGPWCWERLTPLLDAAGVPWAAPDLPSVARASEHRGFEADVLAVENVLDALDGGEPAVLVGHSRGGRVISEAGTHGRVGHLVYLAGIIPLEEPWSPLGNEAADGTYLPEKGVAAQFYSDCPPDLASWATQRLRPQSYVGTLARSPRQAWKLRPSTYAVCSLDRSVSLERQRAMAKHASAVIEWETGHSPFLSRPDLVASLLIELARS